MKLTSFPSLKANTKMARATTTLFAIFQLAIISILSLNNNISVSVPDYSQPIIPYSKAALNNWFIANVKPFSDRKGTLNATLQAAENRPKIIKVRKDGTGNFKTITDAVKSVPVNNKQRVIVDIGAGVYTEKITIERNKPFITFYGSAKAMPTLSYHGTAAQYGTVYSATLTVESEYFVAANLIIQNTAPRPDGKRKGAQAVALRTGGDKAALYNCRILGFQDTLCDDKGRHFFKDCYIEGTFDYIFGSGKSIYLNTELHVVEEKGLRVIAAQARNEETEDTGFVFAHCRVTGKGRGAFLGRAWMKRPRVVYAYTEMGAVVNPAGWFNNFHSEREGTATFAEYKCTGAGSKSAERVKYRKQLTDAEAKPYLSLSFIAASQWLLPSPRV
ncbi:putative pectinesterase 63 [Mercurialis annua]|uniref:putative pectinesterase 63 n=1 Tax=Mercurialis annua TaxID=3986 RepID=UPI0021609CDB|nr:putative pectinesterase 63 [Mercurialis annua]